MEVRECVLAVSCTSSTTIRVKVNIRALEDFGLMLASYGIARVIQTFANLKLPPGETWEDLGAEKQHLTIVLSNASGCKALLD